MRRSCTLKLDFHIQCASVLSDKSTATRASVGDANVASSHNNNNETVSTRNNHKSPSSGKLPCRAKQTQKSATLCKSLLGPFAHSFHRCRRAAISTLPARSPHYINLGRSRYFMICARNSIAPFAHFFSLHLAAQRRVAAVCECGCILPKIDTVSYGLRGHFYIPFHLWRPSTHKRTCIAKSQMI